MKNFTILTAVFAALALSAGKRFCCGRRKKEESL